MNILQEIQEGFIAEYGSPAKLIVRAPGRVNLIGEHTDYNDGFVMPMAIDRATWIALSPRDDERVGLYSLDLDDTVSFDLENLRKEKMSWGEYPKGVAWSLRNEGFNLCGWNGVTRCDVPMGAGLSSSASFELAVARAFAAVSGFEWDAAKMALLCQKAENQWVGVNCGIMDQMISAVGKAGHAVMIDCRDLSTETVPVPAGYVVVIMDTSTRRGLVDSAYNDRRSQCEAAAGFFGVKALRDVKMNAFIEKVNDINLGKWRRAKHVISENARTVEAASAMKAGDAVQLGLLMNASHDSLRDDFEVTNDELDIIVQIARKTPGCLGARMTGAGFGGCAVALVQQGAAQAFIDRVAKDYETKTGLTPKIYLCVASEGAELVQMP